MTGFRWNEWNLDHATKHGCSVKEIESVVRHELRDARPCGDEKFRVEGRGNGNRMVEVIFVFDDEDELEVEDDTIYVIHAMPLTMRRRRGKRRSR